MEWISVKDILPEDDQVVLCYYDGEIFEGLVHIRYANSTEFKQRSWPHMYNIPVTHWMPLPQPPTE